MIENNNEREMIMTQESSKRDLFLSKMPKYNPNPTIMFNHKGEIVFQNDASKKIFSTISRVSDLYEMSKLEMISLIRDIGDIPAKRDTSYNYLEIYKI